MGCIPSLSLPCCLPSSAPRFTVEGVFWGRITKVYDGDTWHAIIRINGHSATFVLRLSGLDTPELKGPGVSPREKEAGAKVGDYCRNKWLGKSVRIVARGLDKYGRLLATIYPVRLGCFTCGMSANEDLLRRGYALPYDGGTKTEWKAKDLNRILGNQAFLPY